MPNHERRPSRVVWAALVIFVAIGVVMNLYGGRTIDRISQTRDDAEMERLQAEGFELADGPRQLQRRGHPRVPHISFRVPPAGR